ncbi:hypothetical protein Pcinc_031767 [Petrolisthes cinctipes]|uniref:Uncharacterized protein n=1 Tax=Petrolisthes cinctipes TaxID=88211 RepID=A0AAE1EVH2_PETCI|nr:hypothetical protein Pcinc_031767 [Petrolisthes cinctipes]
MCSTAHYSKLSASVWSRLTVASVPMARRAQLPSRFCRFGFPQPQSPVVIFWGLSAFGVSSSQSTVVGRVLLSSEFCQRWSPDIFRVLSPSASLPLLTTPNKSRTSIT